MWWVGFALSRRREAGGRPESRQRSVGRRSSQGCDSQADCAVDGVVLNPEDLDEHSSLGERPKLLPIETFIAEGAAIGLLSALIKR